MKVLLFGVIAAFGLGILLATTGAKAQSRRARRVLAVGDSITTGSYPKFLEKLLPEGSEVVTVAISGAETKKIYGEAAGELASGDYDTIVILAGVNDLHNGRGASYASTWLQKMYEEAANAGAVVVAVEVLPWAGYPGGDVLLPETLVLNQWIHNNPLVDTAVNTDSMGNSSRELLSKYDSGGGLHLNRAGNECLAQLVAAAVEKE
jgi:lysophospholipase L1-like esterase